MAPPTHPALQQIYHLDRSSSDFHDKLDNVLHGQEYYQCIPNLKEGDLVWLVNYLDKTLDRLGPSSPAFRKCLRELRSICGARATLPTAYTLPFDLITVGPIPFASGGSGDVYKETLNGSTVCVKRVRVSTQDDLAAAAKIFCQEAVMWKHLKHPNILPLLGVTLSPLQLVSNWMPGGDLSGYVKNSDTNRLGLSRHQLSDVAKGLHYLHSRNVIHGDLKGFNILVDVEHNQVHARIADFGLAIVTKNLNSIRLTTSQNFQTPLWCAPEVLYGEDPTKESDIFSFAMVMIEIFTGAIPFSGRSVFVAISAIMGGERPPRPAHPTFTDNLRTLMQRCWDQDPRLRPEISEVLQILHPPSISH
ncbi:kinase-like protein [Thelephora ganbajun]|uniref:Kinase-like protein n=1 Tax=Thelephora ganbajun TaxID=370292 RepID=A0ACB6Z7L4_THEGA|nr:kinase-like protein [Thelephora ganbajun]